MSVFLLDIFTQHSERERLITENSSMTTANSPLSRVNHRRPVISRHAHNQTHFFFLQWNKKTNFVWRINSYQESEKILCVHKLQNLSASTVCCCSRESSFLSTVCRRDWRIPTHMIFLSTRNFFVKKQNILQQTKMFHSYSRANVKQSQTIRARENSLKPLADVPDKQKIYAIISIKSTTCPLSRRRWYPVCVWREAEVFVENLKLYFSSSRRSMMSFSPGETSFH